MTETQRIKDQLKRAFEGKAWHGPSVKEVLAGVDLQSAGLRPVHGAHSIWEIVHHMAAWADVVNERIHGKPVKEPAAGNFPAAAEPNQQAWADTLAWLESTYSDLLSTLDSLPESRLDEPSIAGSKSTVYGNLHGTIQHYLYHAGQIAVLKKAAI